MLSAQPSPSPETASPPSADAPRPDAGLVALFSRISRYAGRVILPINEAALDEANTGPAFYCVHSLSGAGGTDFWHLAKVMPGVRFFGIQAPPVKMHDPKFGTAVDALANYYVDALMKFQPEGRFFIGGWSAGTIIGLEVAQKLRACGRVVSLFIPIDGTPENTDTRLPHWHPVYLFEAAINSFGWLVNDVIMTKGSLRALLGRGVRKVITKLKSSKAPATGEKVADIIDPVQGLMDVSHYQPFERAFMTRLYAALLAYKPKKYAGTVVAYEATKKPLLHLPQVGRVWNTLAPRSTIVRVKGTHLSILKPGDVEALAQDLEQRIAALALPTSERSAIPAPAIETPATERKLA
jgi:thioesterase domain-containing protein